MTPSPILAGRIKLDFITALSKTVKKELIDVSNWDELSFLYSRTDAIERVVSNYLDILGIVCEKQQLVFLVRQIGRCLFVENIEIKWKNPLPIRINEMPDSINAFYILCQSLCCYAKNLQELNVKDKEVANVNPIPISYCSCHKTDSRLTNK